jgi:hypothetical protein
MSTVLNKKKKNMCICNTKGCNASISSEVRDDKDATDDEVDEDSEYDDDPHEEHITYVIDTNMLDTNNDIENFILIEANGVVMVEFEIKMS